MTNTPKHSPASLRRYLIDDNDWTPHEVLEFFQWMKAQGMMMTHRTEDEWMDLIDKHLKR